MGGTVRKELHLSYAGPSGPIELDCTCSLLVGENSPSSSAGVVLCLLCTYLKISIAVYKFCFIIEPPLSLHFFIPL